ncbi:MAG: Lin0512 family protein [Minwuia sp.]|uniref:Lin0512 family protein n=1 Tax=Minwuia sp. TaxID=2493630 RepID=UPI003A8889FC
MAWKRMCLEIGMGTDIRGGDSTKAAVRALKDALWRNALTIGPAIGQDADDMRVKVWIGAPNPESVDKAQILAVLPHGAGEVEVVEGGLVMPNDPGTDVTVMAHAAAEVFLNVGDPA